MPCCHSSPFTTLTLIQICLTWFVAINYRRGDTYLMLWALTIALRNDLRIRFKYWCYLLWFVYGAILRRVCVFVKIKGLICWLGGSLGCSNFRNMEFLQAICMKKKNFMSETLRVLTAFSGSTAKLLSCLFNFLATDPRICISDSRSLL